MGEIYCSQSFSFILINELLTPDLSSDELQVTITADLKLLSFYFTPERIVFVIGAVSSLSGPKTEK